MPSPFRGGIVIHGRDDGEEEKREKDEKKCICDDALAASSWRNETTYASANDEGTDARSDASIAGAAAESHGATPTVDPAIAAAHAPIAPHVASAANVAAQ